MTNDIQGDSHNVISWFLNRNYKPEGNCMTYLKWWQGRKGKNPQPRILYRARLSLRFDEEIESFPDKQKLREFSTTKAALQQELKELL